MRLDLRLGLLPDDVVAVIGPKLGNAATVDDVLGFVGVAERESCEVPAVRRERANADGVGMECAFSTVGGAVIQPNRARPVGLDVGPARPVKPPEAGKWPIARESAQHA